MEIKEEFRNDLLKRSEIQAVINSGSNPGVGLGKKMIMEKLKISEDKIAIKNIKSTFGRDSFLIKAFVYDTLEDKEMIEHPKIKKK